MSLDHLVDDIPRRSLHAPDHGLGDRLAEIGEMSAEDRASLTAQRRGRPHEEGILDTRELALMRGLADGVTVQQLAKRFGYCEREIHRILHEIYQRMGVENRSAAIARAARWGLLDGP